MARSSVLGKVMLLSRRTMSALEKKPQPSSSCTSRSQCPEAREGIHSTGAIQSNPVPCNSALRLRETAPYVP